MNISENLFDKDKKRSSVVTYLYELGVSPNNFRINNDLSVDIVGDFTLKNKAAKKWKYCPIKFRNIYGNFIWHYGSLITLFNMPEQVTKNYSIAYNNLNFLENSPYSVGGAFICSGNKLINLKNCPRKVESILAVNCELTSLEGAPKSIDSLFVSNNKLTSLSFLPTTIETALDISNNLIEDFQQLIPHVNKLKKLYFTGNPCENEIQKIINKSKQLELYEPTSQDKPQSLKTPEFNVGDYVIFRNKDSKFDGVIGEITERIPVGNDANYKIKALMSENPTLSQVSSNSNQGYTVIKNIVSDELTKTTKPELTELPKKSVYNGVELIDGNNFKPGDKAYYYSTLVELIKPNTSTNWVVKNLETGALIYTFYKDLMLYEDPKNIVLHPANRFSVGDIVNYYTQTVEIIEPVTPTKWKIKYNSGYQFNVEYNFLTPITPLWFKVGDEIIINDENSRYFNKKGTVVNLVNDEKEQPNMVDIELQTTEGEKPIVLNSFPKNKIKLYLSPTNETTAGRVFAKGDKIIYIANKNNTLHNDCHLRKGVVSLVNTTYNLKDTYDLVFDKLKNETYEKRIVNIPWYNLILFEQDFEIGDKVVIFAPYNNHHDIVGVVKEFSEDGTYKITYHVDNKTRTIISVKPNQLIRFYKPIGSECNIDDNVKYTKPNSRYFGCSGVVVTLNKNKKNKPYMVEISTKDGQKIKLWSNDVDLEVIPGPRTFRKGDKIRYINPGDKYDGYIGEIITVTGTKNNRTYDIVLKLKANGNLYMSAKLDQLMLLEEATAPETFKNGDKIKYINDSSKWNNHTGEFIGYRNKDGKNQIGVKFQETTNIYKTVYFDDGEGKFEKIENAPTTIYNSYNTTTKKKKKKNDTDDESKPPILVYNRRQSVRKAKPKPADENPEESKEQ